MLVTGHKSLRVTLQCHSTQTAVKCHACEVTHLESSIFFFFFFFCVLMLPRWLDSIIALLKNRTDSLAPRNSSAPTTAHAHSTTAKTQSAGGCTSKCYNFVLIFPHCKVGHWTRRTRCHTLRRRRRIHLLAALCPSYAHRGDRQRCSEGTRWKLQAMASRRCVFGKAPSKIAQSHFVILAEVHYSVRLS